MVMDIYSNEFTVTPTSTHTLAVADSLTVDDLDLVVGDANFTLDVGTRLTDWINFNCEAFLVVFRDVTTNGKPIYFQGITLDTRMTGR